MENEKNGLIETEESNIEITKCLDEIDKWIFK